MIATDSTNVFPATSRHGTVPMGLRATWSPAFWAPCRRFTKTERYASPLAPSASRTRYAEEDRQYV